MGQEQFDRLLEAMPRIAEAVNGFTSEELQRDALNALVQAFGLPTNSAGAKEAERRVTDSGAQNNIQPEASPADSPGASTGAATKRLRKASAKRTVAPVKDLDLRPPGKKTFKELVSEKRPTGTYQYNLLAVYYLQEELELKNINAGHIVVAYRECGWREPNNLPQALRDTAAKRGWLDTSNGNNITITPQGRNVAVHDMPFQQPPGK